MNSMTQSTILTVMSCSHTGEKFRVLWELNPNHEYIVRETNVLSRDYPVPTKYGAIQAKFTNTGFVCPICNNHSWFHCICGEFVCYDGTIAYCPKCKWKGEVRIMSEHDMSNYD